MYSSKRDDFFTPSFFFSILREASISKNGTILDAKCLTIVKSGAVYNLDAESYLLFFSSVRSDVDGFTMTTLSPQVQLVSEGAKPPNGCVITERRSHK